MVVLMYNDRKFILNICCEILHLLNISYAPERHAYLLERVSLIQKQEDASDGYGCSDLHKIRR